MTQNSTDLIARVKRLEDIESIKQLKARYLSSCDAKLLGEIKSCFVEGEAFIDYGPIGSFNNRDELLQLFERIACHEYMIEMHHGQNPRIVISSEDTAEGQWDLFYHLINTQEGTLTQLGGTYQDEYRRTNNGWKISKTVFRPHSSVVTTIADGKPLFSGNPLS